MAQMVNLVDMNSADSRISQSTMQQKATGILSKPYEEFTTFQKLQIQKERLRFLRACKPLKRPPSSLRITGASAIDDIDKLCLFSELESKMLDQGIRNKLNLISELVELSKNVEHIPISNKDRTALENHFSKKLSHFRKQDSTKWVNWPQKPTKILKNMTKKVKNFKKRQSRKRRKLKKQAKKIVESSSVIILVNEEVPLGAISVLGKGLGFIPTPNVDIHQTRLDMRLTRNRILRASRKNLHESQPTDDEKPPPDPNYSLPSKLHRQFYGLANSSPEQPVNDIIEQIEVDLDSRLLKNVNNTNKRSMKQNLTFEEQEGLKWLIN